ncbi:MAG: Asp-tRNA(Asn)/Glu-tRNA(Gln) amidotransferase subunit GatB [Oscillospiraceae bacterium]|nr:Asp-tRNA(Asn)/Glu-tRNA(Gln) amidotransferase subunit GatB [Oscillospiraceae bacterium]
MNWEVVMGVEVHAELSTKSKIFCGCTTSFGGQPNTHVCPVCAGMPGVLPRLNKAVVEYAIKLGLTLDCEITRLCRFDRKNYFYPDLPKAYQVSQLYLPICRNGNIEITVGGEKKKIGIREIHMEEDAGKLTHDPQSGTHMDFNRCGVPLLEIVTEPDFRSGEEVLAYLEQLRETLLYLDICDCKMQEGSLRADVNISVRRPGEELGIRTEMKNLNSFKAIGRAIEYETGRQIKTLENGGHITQETRRWDDEKGESYSMRSKENAQDYRYFPEPDLLPIKIDDRWIEGIRSDLPELAHQKRERYMRDYALSEYETSVLTGHKSISDLFEDLSNQTGEPTESAHLITGVIMQLMNSTATLPEDLNIDSKKLSYLVSLVVAGKINRGAYKDAIEAVFTDDTDPEKYIADNGLMMVSDDRIVSETVDIVLADNADAVSDYHSGKDRAFGFLIGQVMKRMGGSGNPNIAREILRDRLG